MTPVLYGKRDELRESFSSEPSTLGVSPISGHCSDCMARTARYMLPNGDVMKPAQKAIQICDPCPLLLRISSGGHVFQIVSLLLFPFKVILPSQC